MLQAKAEQTDEASTTQKNPSDLDYGNEVEDEEDEIEYEVYYNSNDIRKTLLEQDQNLFSDIN